MLCLFLTTSSVLQEMFMRTVLKYDALNAVSINWCVFIGILAGAGVVFTVRLFCGKDISC